MYELNPDLADAWIARLEDPQSGQAFQVYRTGECNCATGWLLHEAMLTGKHPEIVRVSDGYELDWSDDPENCNLQDLERYIERWLGVGEEVFTRVVEMNDKERRPLSEIAEYLKARRTELDAEYGPSDTFTEGTRP